MKVIWALSAEQDRADIIEFISLDNPIASIMIDELFAEVAMRLEQHPLLGKPGRILGTRELIPHANYRLIYEVQDNQIRILALVHTARLWPTPNL
jgi:addiction module RelE/StbE family toxin